MSVQAHSITKQTEYQTILKHDIKQTEYQAILKQDIKQTEYQAILKHDIKQTEYQVILMKQVTKYQYRLQLSFLCWDFGRGFLVTFSLCISFDLCSWCAVG